MKLELQFDSLATFLQMGGHGLYIWAAFGITLVVLAILFFTGSFAPFAAAAAVRLATDQ